jgi:centractin
MDLRKTLYNEIVVAGGTTMTQGFPDRFIYEVRKFSPKDAKVINYL